MQRRVISSNDTDTIADDEENDEKMDIEQAPPPPTFRIKDKKNRIDSADKSKKTSLLSFNDEGSFFLVQTPLPKHL